MRLKRAYFLIVFWLMLSWFMFVPASHGIVALADVYDALVSKRVYKKAIPHDIARSIIIKEKGKRFDPDIVDTFLKCEESFITIHNRFVADD